MSDVPLDFYDKVSKTFDAAVESGDLIYSEGETKNSTIDEIQYRYSIVPALKKKPTAEDNAPKKDENAESSKPFDPFDPPAPELLVLPEYKENYAVVLNKFAVIPRHFLLVTKEFQPQNAPLTPDDLEASYHLLKETNYQSRKRHIGFFNCGKDSGASVAHRHVQFFTLPDGFKPFPDDLRAEGRKYEDKKRPLTHDKIKFAHFIVPVHDTAADDLGFRFSTLLSRVLTTLRDNEAKSISYNFLFTEEWFMVVPRKAEKADNDISINAVGTIGLLLAKGEEELEYIEKTGPAEIIESVCFPRDDEDEVEYHY